MFRVRVCEYRKHIVSGRVISRREIVANQDWVSNITTDRDGVVSETEGRRGEGKRVVTEKKKNMVTRNQPTGTKGEPGEGEQRNNPRGLNEMELCERLREDVV